MNDKDMVPIAGHVLRVEAPWVGSVLIDSRFNHLALFVCESVKVKLKVNVRK